MDKEVRDLVRALRRQGFRVEEGRKHLKVYPPVPGAKPYPLPKTPSDRRWLKNAISHLRKYGFEWPPEKGKGKKKRKT
ncbi:MAG TPA: hypothetical protein VIK75_05795 [Calditerricola sp.]